MLQIFKNYGRTVNQKDYEELQSFLKGNGIKFGYPSCCISEFLINSSKDVTFHLAKPRRKLDGTGYIPCHDCNEKYTEAELIATIMKNRTFSLPFPEDGIR